MEHYITYAEMFLYARLPQTSRGKQPNGAILSVSLSLLVFCVTLKLCRFAALIYPTARFVLQMQHGVKRSFPYCRVRREIP